MKISGLKGVAERWEDEEARKVGDGSEGDSDTEEEACETGVTNAKSSASSAVDDMDDDENDDDG